MSKGIVFLMRELSGYFVSSVQHWKKNFNGNVWVVYWPANQDAPFQWEMNEEIVWMEKKNFFSEIQPTTFWPNIQQVFVAGWGDEAYNEVVQQYPIPGKTLLFDTQWKPSWKMYLGRFWLYLNNVRYFDSAWVPGDRQRALAKKLFFKSNRIFDHFYVGDQSLFENKSQPIAKHGDALHIVFAGRLIPEKGILPLIHSFIQAMQANPDWNGHLHVCGTGPLSQDCPEHPRITYHGFVQPKDLAVLFQSMDVFVLPSTYEPWGVVVHEAAFAGLAIMVSDAVGSGDAFVETGKNGWVFSNDDFPKWMEQLRQYQCMTQEEKSAMSKHSIQLAKSVVLDTWALMANQILSLPPCAE